jgi:hypothetical protein
MSEQKRLPIGETTPLTQSELAELFIRAFAVSGARELQSPHPVGSAQRSLNLYHALIELGADAYWEQVKDDEEVLALIAAAKDDAYQHRQGPTVTAEKVHNIIESALQSEGEILYLEMLVHQERVRRATAGF